MARAAGVHSVSADEIRGFGMRAPSDGLDFPSLDANGVALAHRVRFDTPDDGAKFKASPGVSRPFLVSSDALELAGSPRDVYGTATTRLVVVGGPAKALALVSHGIVPIGLGGVSVGAHDADLHSLGRVVVRADDLTALSRTAGTRRAHPNR